MICSLCGSSRRIQLPVFSDRLDDSALVFSSFPHSCPLGISSQIKSLNTNFVSASTSEDKPFSLNDSLYFSLSLRTTKGQGIVLEGQKDSSGGRC